jgi:hypothetical protein
LDTEVACLLQPTAEWRRDLTMNMDESDEKSDAEGKI